MVGGVGGGVGPRWPLQPGWTRPAPCRLPFSCASLVNLYDRFVGVVFVVRLACVVFAGGVHRQTRWASASLVIVRSSSNLGGVAVFRYITTVVLAPLPGPLGGVVGVSRDGDPVVVVAVGVRPVPRPQQLRAVEPPQPKVFGQDRVAVPGDAVGDKSGLLGTQLRNPQARRLRGDDRVVGVGLTPQPLRAGGRGDRRRRYYRRRAAGAVTVARGAGTGTGTGEVTVLTEVTVEGATGVAIEMTVAGSEDVRVGEVSTTVAAITTAITATQAPITATMIGDDRRDQSWCSDDG